MITSLCIYRVKPGSESAFRTPGEALAGVGARSRFWLPTCRRRSTQGAEGENEPIFVELLHWKDAEGARRAHELPEVMGGGSRWAASANLEGQRPPMRIPACRANRSRLRALGRGRRELDSVFAALDSSARRQILMILHFRGDQMTSGQIADRFSCAWPTTSRAICASSRTPVWSTSNGRGASGSTSSTARGSAW